MSEIANFNLRGFHEVALPHVKKYKQKKDDREIIFGSFLWSQKRVQSIQHARITTFSTQEQLQTPLELRDRSI